jgi:hypothetical protein
VNLWMKRALGVAVLGGGLLALNAASASAQEVSADVSARLGRPTSAEVRVCADGRVLSGLLGSCSGQGTSATVRAGRGGDGSSGVRATARVPRLASADVSVGTGANRPSTGASGQAPATPAPAATADAAVAADTSPRADADATANLSEPLLDLRLLDSRPLASFAGVGLLGSSPFTLAGDPATDSLLAIGDLLPEGLTGEAPAGIGVLETGPIASGNQVGVDVGDLSPSVPMTVCGNGVGVLGDTSASCGASQAPTTGAGSTGSAGTSAGTGGSASDPLLADLASGNQVDAGIGDVSPSTPVTVCGNGVGVLGDASAGCGANQQASSGGTSGGSASGSTGASAGTTGSATLLDDVASGNQVDAGIGSISPSVPVTVCGNSAGVLGDTSASCGPAQPASPTTGPAGSSPDDRSTQAAGTLAGNQVTAGAGDVSPSVPVTVCGNSAGVLGDASASCGAPAPAATADSSTDSAGAVGLSIISPSSVDPAAATVSSTGAVGLTVSLPSSDSAAATGTSTGSASITVSSPGSTDSGDISGGATGSVGITTSTTSPAGSAGARGGSTNSTGVAVAVIPTGIGTGVTSSGGTSGSAGASGGSTPAGGTAGDDQVGVSSGGTVADSPETASGCTVGPGGDALIFCGANTSSSGIIAPTPPGGTPGSPGRTDTVGITAPPGFTGTVGTVGTEGLTPGTGDPITTFAADRPFAAGSGSLPFTGAAGDLLAMLAAGLLLAGALVLRAARPAAVKEGGGDR